MEPVTNLRIQIERFSGESRVVAEVTILLVSILAVEMLRETVKEVKTKLLGTILTNFLAGIYTNVASYMEWIIGVFRKNRFSPSG